MRTSLTHGAETGRILSNSKSEFPWDALLRDNKRIHSKLDSASGEEESVVSTVPPFISAFLALQAAHARMPLQ